MKQLVLFIVGLSLAVQAYALDISAEYGHIQPKVKNVQSSNYVGASIVAPINESVSGGIEVLASRLVIESDGYEIGVLSVMPIMGVTKVTAKINDKLTVYASGASGVIVSSVNENNELTDYGIKIEAKPALCSRVGVGAEYNVSKDIVVTASVSRFTGEVELSTGGNTEDFDLSSWLFGGSVILRF